MKRIKDFLSAHLEYPRNIDVYLPPGYETNLNTRYKVLILNDGQDMESMGARITLEMLYYTKAIEKILVVAIYHTKDRLNEYGVAGIPNAQGRGARAGDYTQFVINEVLPFIREHFRTLEGPANTAILGASLGGLSAFDMAWRHPEVFGKVGVFSGSFWWRTDDTNFHTKQTSRIMHRVVHNTKVKPAIKCWFQAGTKDETSDRDHNGVIDAIQDTTELMDEMALKGFKAGVDMTYFEVEGGEHNQLTWGKAFPHFLRWAFPAQPTLPNE